MTRWRFSKRGERPWWRRAARPDQPLPQRNIFLLPTRFGLGWLVLLLVVMLFGINYENSLAYALAFWLLALGVVVLFRAWHNLRGVCLGLRPPREIFVGSPARITITADSRRPRTGLVVLCAGGRAEIDVPEKRGEGELSLVAVRRGPWRLPLLRLECRWPLGLVRAVAWVDSDAELLVWPQPVADDASSLRPSGPGQDSGDFAGLRRFEPGDSVSRVAWKQWSRSGVLATKAFESPPREAVWLDYDQQRGDPERRLSQLCGQVLAHQRAGDIYGLRLPGQTLAPGQGEAHRRQVLDALARWRTAPGDFS